MAGEYEKDTVQYKTDHYEINFQNGPVQEHGVNGCQIEDIIDVAIARINFLNNVLADGKFRCRENSLAVTKLQESKFWLEHRTKMREQQKVEGTNKVHTS